MRLLICAAAAGWGSVRFVRSGSLARAARRRGGRCFLEVGPGAGRGRGRGRGVVVVLEEGALLAGRAGLPFDVELVQARARLELELLDDAAQLPGEVVAAEEHPEAAVLDLGRAHVGRRVGHIDRREARWHRETLAVPERCRSMVGGNEAPPRVPRDRSTRAFEPRRSPSMLRAGRYTMSSDASLDITQGAAQGTRWQR